MAGMRDHNEAAPLMEGRAADELLPAIVSPVSACGACAVCACYWAKRNPRYAELHCRSPWCHANTDPLAVRCGDPDPEWERYVGAVCPRPTKRVRRG